MLLELMTNFTVKCEFGLIALNLSRKLGNPRGIYQCSREVTSRETHTAKYPLRNAILLE